MERHRPPPRSPNPAASAIRRYKSTTKARPVSDAALGDPSKDNCEGGDPPRRSAAAIPRSQSAAKARPASSAAIGLPFKENREGLPNPSRKPKPPARTAWSLSPARTPPRSSTALPDAGRREKSGGASAWERSPGRSPLLSASLGGRKGSFEVLGGSLWSRTELWSGEEEKHQFRMLSLRLIQWRFANARVAAAMEAAQCDAQEKLIHVWLKNYELRNLVAAKQILIRRQTLRMRLIRILSPLVQLLNQWEPHAKRHFEAAATLGKVLRAVSLLLPLVEGAQANLVSVHRYMCSAMNMMKGIADTAGMLYSMAENIDSVLDELLKTIRMEIAGFKELMEMFERVPISQFG